MHALGEWVSNSRMKHENHLEGLLKHKLLGPIPVPVSGAGGLGHSPRTPVAQDREAAQSVLLEHSIH